MRFLKNGENVVFLGAPGVGKTYLASAAVEQVLTFWVAVAKAEGSVEITASNSAGKYGSMTLTVGSAVPTTPEVPTSGDSTSLTDNEESQAAVDAGYPYGFGDNLTVFTGTANAAHCAVNNWINSPGHFQTMIDPRCDCIGVGVTQYDGITYCYMFVGIPNSVNFYT